MEIPKDKILELRRQRGDHDKAEQADRQLPDQVDPERDRGILEQLGIDPQDLLGNLPGGLGDKLGL
jgi:predicted PhzF superfamily epimerase YddE/YHI9